MLLAYATLVLIAALHVAPSQYRQGWSRPTYADARGGIFRGSYPYPVPLLQGKSTVGVVQRTGIRPSVASRSAFCFSRDLRASLSFDRSSLWHQFPETLPTVDSGALSPWGFGSHSHSIISQPLNRLFHLPFCASSCTETVRHTVETNRWRAIERNRSRKTPTRMLSYSLLPHRNVFERRPVLPSGAKIFTVGHMLPSVEVSLSPGALPSRADG